jgi:hypothetical protein
LHTLCVAAEPHPVTIKSLIAVKFTNEDEKSNHPICPACMKGLNNGTKISSKSVSIEQLFYRRHVHLQLYIISSSKMRACHLQQMHRFICQEEPNLLCMRTQDQGKGHYRHEC